MGAAAGVQQHESSEFEVDLVSAPMEMTPTLPPSFILKLCAECVEILEKKSKHLLCNIIYTDIESWTKSPGHFTLNLPAAVLGTTTVSKITVELSDAQCKTLQTTILQKINLLMDRMKEEGYTINDFAPVLATLLEENKILKSDWIDLLGTEKKLTSFQALSVYKHLQSDYDFDRMDSICHLYSLLLNKSTFQILVNALDSAEERENVLHRLNLLKSTGLTRDASNLSSRSPIPGSMGSPPQPA